MQHGTGLWFFPLGCCMPTGRDILEAVGLHPSVEVDGWNILELLNLPKEGGGSSRWEGWELWEDESSGSTMLWLPQTVADGG